MKFTPPRIELISGVFPEIKELALCSQGGFKAVYRAKTDSGVEAFKLLCLPAVSETAEDKKDEQAIRDGYLARALREIKLLGSLDIPETVKLGTIPARIETIEGLEYLGYSEEWLAGDNLWDLLRNPSRGLPPENECRTLLVCLITAIQHLWNQGCVHRDIKPHNVMKVPDSRRPFVLLDMGIAYDVKEPGLTYTRAAPPATYRYLAPEMAEANFRDKIDFRSDLYTSGLTVFEYATGKHPVAHDSDDILKTVSRALHYPPARLANLRADFSSAFCEIIDKLIRKKPMLRPGNLALLQQQIKDLK